MNLESLRFLTAQGFKPIKLDEFLALLDYAITQPIRGVKDSQLVVGVSDLDPEIQATNFTDAKFSHLRIVGKQASTASAEASSLESLIKNFSSLTEVHHIIRNAIIAQVSKVPVVPVEDINPVRAISSYGGDSLAAVELRNWFARSLDALSRKSIDALAREVVGRRGLGMELDVSTLSELLFPIHMRVGIVEHVLGVADLVRLYDMSPNSLLILEENC